MAEGEACLAELDPIPATRLPTVPVIHHDEVNGLGKGAEELGGSKLKHEEVLNSGDRLFPGGDDDRKGRVATGGFHKPVGNKAIRAKGPEEVVQAGRLTGIWRKDLKPLAPDVDPFSELTDSKFQAICSDLDEQDLGHGLSPRD